MKENIAKTIIQLKGRVLVKGATPKEAVPVLASDIPLSLWGGVDPLTGEVIDAHHPLAGRSLTDHMLCLPSGRGSSTASQVLLELILNAKAPRLVILRDIDPLLCVGAIVAKEIFQEQARVPTIIHIGDGQFRTLLEGTAESESVWGAASLDGEVILGSKEEIKIPSSCEGVDEDSLILTDEEELLLCKCNNQAEEMALRVVFQYARVSGTKKYVSISSAHIDGCTYIGPGGLDFVRRLVSAGGTVKVPTTLNAQSTDRKQWRSLGVPATYANAANALGEAYVQLGCQPTFTCAPYLGLEGSNHFGEDWVWGESNAVVFANSVIGAKTNKTADYLDICCALAGKVPLDGMYDYLNRKPSIILDGRDLFKECTELNDDVFPVLGHLCGTLSNGQVPLLIGLEKCHVSRDNLKAFCAAFGTTGSSPLIHVAGVTPEAIDDDVLERWIHLSSISTVEITQKQLEDRYELLDKNKGSKIDLVALGNPHLSITECQHLVELVAASDPRSSSMSKKNPDTRIIACISRAIQGEANEAGLIQPLKDFGMEFINDTCWCMLLHPPIIPAHIDATILTNSGKYAHYGPGLVQRNFRFGSITDCVQAAKTGHFSSDRRRFQLQRGYHTFASKHGRILTKLIQIWR